MLEVRQPLALEVVIKVALLDSHIINVETIIYKTY